MGERHDAEREIAQARARMSEIAEELSRRASPDYVRERAREMADDVKSRATAKARERSMEMREKVMENPWALGLVGGAVGAIAGKLIGDRAKDRYESRHPGYHVAPGGRVRSYEYDETYRTPVSAEGGVIITEDEMYGLDTMPDVRDRTNYDVEAENARYRAEMGGAEHHGLREKASERLENAKQSAKMGSHAVKGFAEDIRHRASDRIGHMREQRGSHPGFRERASSSAHNLRERSHGLSGRARGMVQSSKDHEAILGIGAMAAGVLFGLLMPITNKERQTLGPAKEKAVHRAEEQIKNVRDQAIHRAQDVEHRVRDVVKSEIGRGFSGSEGEEQRESREEGIRGEEAGFTETRGTYTASEEGSQYTPVPEPDVTRH